MRPKTVKVPTKGDSDFYFIFSFNFILSEEYTSPISFQRHNNSTSQLLSYIIEMLSIWSSLWWPFLANGLEADLKRRRSEGEADLKRSYEITWISTNHKFFVFLMQRYAKVFIHANENAEKSSLHLYFFHTIIYGKEIVDKSL